MSTPDTQPALAPRQPITDDQKLIAMQLLELAMSTPTSIAGMNVDFDGNNNCITVRGYKGGWSESTHPDGADFSVTFYLDIKYSKTMESTLAETIAFVEACKNGTFKREEPLIEEAPHEAPIPAEQVTPDEEDITF